MPATIVMPTLFMILFYNLASPSALFSSYLLIAISGYYVTSGSGYFFSILRPPETAQLLGVVFGLISSMFAGAFPTIQSMDQGWVV